MSTLGPVTAAPRPHVEGPPGGSEFEFPAVLRPHRSLLTYYTLGSFLLGPGFFIALIPLYFRYHTLRYEIDAEGITARWGILFRKEVLLTYARIQDIHLTSNLIERWLGLAKVKVQTASGNASAEMTIEGMPQFEVIRDFLYTRMRGAKGHRATEIAGAPGSSPGQAGVGPDELAAALRDIAGEVRALRLALAPARGAASDDG